MMKKIYVIFAVILIVAGCVKPELGNDGTNILRIASVSVASSDSRAVISGPLFPAEEAAEGVGLFLTASDGSLYDGLAQGFSNVKYYYDGERWNSDNVIVLSASKGTLSGYFPYDSSVTDINSIPVESSYDGIDYMYFEPVEGVCSISGNVSLEMKHALALVSVKFVKDGEYTGDGMLSSIAISGEGIAAEASLNAITGALTPSGASELAFEIPVSKGKITSAGTVENFLVVPRSEEGKTLNMTCVIDGEEYSLILPAFIIRPGMKSELVVNVRNIGVSVADVSNGLWDEGVTLTLPGGNRVEVGTVKEVYDFDVLANAYVSGNTIIVEAVSKAGYPLVCKVPDGLSCSVVEERTNGLRKFVISGISSDCSVELAYDVVSFARKDVAQKGYYKDIFLDAGLGLDAESTIPKAIVEIYNALSNAPSAIDQVELLYTYGYSSNQQEDTLTQNNVLCGSEKDLNGALLYPDGEPRFKLLYVYGGSSNKHGLSLGAKGRENVNTFFANGGSYSGSCAGCFLSCAKLGGNVSDYRFDLFDRGNYLTSGMNIGSTYYTDITLEKGTPFDDFSELAEKPGLDSLRHNGGAMLDESWVPEGTEVLARFSSTAYPEENVGMNSNLKKCLGKPCMWAYKRNAASGRLVVCGSHPEVCNTDDVTKLFKGEILYAMDGFGNATAKDVLYNGEARIMNLKEGDPGHCGIGDGQYHNFVIFLPSGAAEMELVLEWDSRASLDLALKYDSFAFEDSDYSLESPLEPSSVHSPLTIKAKDLKPGLWYVSVHCANRVKGVYQKKTIYGHHSAHWFDYQETVSDVDLLALNGVPYTITASWK